MGSWIGRCLTVKCDVAEFAFVVLRVLLFVATFASAVASTAFAQSLPIRVRVYPFTGEVRFQNLYTLSEFPFVWYSIHSPGGKLDPAAWTSIADLYDAPPGGNGFIDPLNNWAEVEATTTHLIEGVSTGPGGSLPVFRSLSLGKIWNHGTTPELAVPDLQVSILHPNELSATVIDIRRSINGDYDDNRIVDVRDYQLWRQWYGSNVNDGLGFFYPADGNLDGRVDGGDYVVWRNNLGKVLPPLAGEGSGSGGFSLATAVPEPASMALILAAGGFGLTARRRRRRTRS